MRALLGFLILAASCAPATVAHAQGQCAEFSATAADLRVTYDPFLPAMVDRSFNIQVRRVDPKVSAVRILLADPDPAGPDPLMGLNGVSRYDVVWSRDPSRHVFAIGPEQPNATNGALIGFSSRGGQTVQNESFRLRIPAGQDVGAGNYYQSLEVRYQCLMGDAEVGTPGFQSGAQLAIDLHVPEQISTFIGSAGLQRGRLDFGVVPETGGAVSRSLSITAQSTLPYDIDIRSENGALRRYAEDDRKLDYSLWLSGVPVKTGARLACSRGTAPAGQAHLLRAEIAAEQVKTAAAGTYSDVVTLTFSPRLGLPGGQGCSIITP
ncbi:hypothetical protein [Qipengyuania qiaonensis]|uniref:Uncharacterized protein n=1 Tax=Qipengyuania qiaonensis TaxID=2867240 RepID=A0ABS7JCM8_9SPHN|nr:hypothetical protein [Qipengyuania qiaonensis]MBX7483433.1 hypothetical protein [Qipengyuania qiaonensis]